MNPQIGQVLPDAAARARSLDTGQSFIVQAPAGSGKTELLMQRFLALLGQADQPESIVALTFTLKAAAEMRTRIVRALKQAAEGVIPAQPHLRVSHGLALAALENDQRRGWHLQAAPNRLRILTIDALNLSIASQMPWTSRLGGSVVPEENPDYLYREAALSTLQMVADLEIGGKVRTFLHHIDNQVDRGLVFLAALLSKRDQWLRHTGAGLHSDEDLLEIRHALQADLRSLTSAALRGLAQMLDESLLQAIDVEVAARNSDLTPQSHAWWLAARTILLTEAGEIRKRVPDVAKGSAAAFRLEHLLHRLRDVDGFSKRLKRVDSLPTNTFADEQWETISALLAILPMAVAHLERLFQQRGTVDFIGIGQSALRALGSDAERTDLALLIGERIQHLLVDEFQDTSLAQWQLLRRLTEGWGEGQTLFLVGDPMQSIYRFRQAQVGLFREAQQRGIQDVALESLLLSANFRSRPEVVDWNNRVFSQVFNNEDEVGFSPSVAIRATDGSEDPAVVANLDVTEQQEAEAIANVTRNAVGTVAILARTRLHLAPIIEQFHQQNIPFQAVDIERLGDRPVIQDLHALTRAIFHLADRTAWLASLRAPLGLGFGWGGATLPELVQLAATENSTSVIWDALQARIGRLPTDRQAALQIWMTNMSAALSDRGRIPVAELVERTWTALQGFVAHPTATNRRDTTRFFQLLQNVAPGSALMSFAELQSRIDGLFAEPDLAASDRIQLMTIHKAKGLEFDHVILCGLGRPANKGDEDLIVFSEQVNVDEERSSLLVAVKSAIGKPSDPLYRYVRAMDQSDEIAESKRLLYVAATRAKQYLHLFASAPNGKPIRNSLLDRLQPGLSALPTVAHADRNSEIF
jgi:ATP-dependent helicase/nuclease subunit A